MLIPLSVKKCPCGSEFCKHYWVEGLWDYVQGSGCKREVAIRIKETMIKNYPDIYEDGGKDDK